MVNVATKLIMGDTLKALGYQSGLYPESEYIAVKAPVFSFGKLRTVDTFLGPERKSTGECMGVDKKYLNALYKAFRASGLNLPHGGNVLLSINDRDKFEASGIASKLIDLGFVLLATDNTYKYLKQEGFEVKLIEKASVCEALESGDINMVINTPTRGKIAGRTGFMIRRISMEFNIPCLTSLDTTLSALTILEQIVNNKDTEVYSLDEYSKPKKA